MDSADIGLVESVLYLENEPVDLRRLARITLLPRAAILEAVAALREAYGREEHGIELVEMGGGFCFAPKKRHHDALKQTYGRRNTSRLSRAAMETLSIVAYSQPITKAEIESIRGVAADGMIKVLMDAGLIKEVGKRDSPGKPLQYGTTRQFLIRFGLSSIAGLPKLEEADRERFEPYVG
jgi:segregation and condensation protein B